MTIHLFPIVVANAWLLAGAPAAFCYPACPAGPSSGGGGSGNATEQTWNFNAPTPFYGAVTGAPFSSQNSQLFVQTASNGAHMGGPAVSGPMRYRDSLGRERTDSMTRPFGPGGQPRVTQLARIYDPVTGYLYILDALHQIAYRIPLCSSAPPAAHAPVVGPPPNRPSGTMTDEDLGTQTMFGVNVTGRRMTTTWPPGSYQNNDITVISTMETWTSKQYGEFVSKRTDPQSESSTTITTFSAVEPDPSLFQIPASYQVVDETAPFSVTVHYDNK